MKGACARQEHDARQPVETLRRLTLTTAVDTGIPHRRPHSIIAMVTALLLTMTAPTMAESGRLAFSGVGETSRAFEPVGGFVGVNPQIESVWLVDADADEVITMISDGDVFDRALLPPNLNVTVEASTDTESVQSGYGGIPVVRTENVAPYALGGDNGGDYQTYPLPDGWHTVRARPFAANDATGSYGDEVLISFAIFEHEIVVDSTIDAHDSAPGDGICASSFVGGIDGFASRTNSGDRGSRDFLYNSRVETPDHLTNGSRDQRQIGYLD